MVSPKMIRVTLVGKTGYALTASSLRELDNALIVRAFEQGYPVENCLGENESLYSDYEEEEEKF